MSRVTIQEAVSRARRDLLPVRGVVAVSASNDSIVVYIEDSRVADILPRTYMGYPVVFKVTGRVMPL